MSFLRKAHIAADKFGVTVVGTLTVFGGALFLRYYMCGSYRQQLIERQFGFADMLFEKELQKKQGISKDDYTQQSA